MLEAATFTWVTLGFALLHAAEPRRRPRRFQTSSPTWSPAALRVAGIVVLAWSVMQWSRFDGITAAALVVLAMFCGAATLFVLLAPVAPRFTWGLAIACIPAGLVLSVLGAPHG